MTFLDRLSRGPKAFILLFFMTLLSAAPGVFNMPALDRDESRFAQASKEMLEEGDYIRIQYQDELRNKKPAGIHWLQAAATAVTTGPEAKQIWTYRIPSWLGAALGTVVCFWAGIPLIGRRASFLGAAMFGATLLLTSEAHIAKTDGMLIFLTTLTVGALARLYMTDRPTKKMALLFWLAMGLGFLIKGPVTPMVVAFAGIGAWGYAAWKGDKSNDNWKMLLWWPGPLLFVLLVLPWFLWIQSATQGTFVQGAVGKDLKDKFVGASEGHGGLPGYHLLHIPVWFFPATMMFIPGIVSTVKALRQKSLTAIAHGTEGLMVLVAWGGLTWIFFECLPTKLSHYILPAYPAFGLIAGYGAVQMMDKVRMPVTRWVSLTLFAIGAIALLAASFPGVVEYLMRETAGDFKTATETQVMALWDGMQDYTLLLWIAGFLLSGIALIEFARERDGIAILFGILASIAIGWHVRWVMLPSQIWVQPTETARMALEDVCGVPGMGGACIGQEPARILALGYAEPSYVLTLGTQNLHPPETPTDLPTADADYPIVYLVNMEDRKAKGGMPAIVDNLYEQGINQGRCISESEPYYALNYSNGDPAAFRAIRFDNGKCFKPVGAKD